MTIAAREGVFNDSRYKAVPELITQRQTIWQNRHLQFAIRSYPSSINEEGNCIKTFASEISTRAYQGVEESFFSPQKNVIFIILNHLAPKDLMSCSNVSKNFYLATKTELLWEKQLEKLLPQVQALSRKECSFTPEQQFKIIFKAINDQKKPFIDKFNQNQNSAFEWSEKLKGLGNKIQELMRDQKDEVCSRLVILSREDFLQFSEALNQVPEEEFDQIEEIVETILECQNCLVRLKYLCGDDRAVEFWDKDSQLGRLFSAIENVSAAFNDQEKFEETIRKFEAYWNTTFQFDFIPK
jgi:hypothetical protein